MAGYKHTPPLESVELDFYCVCASSTVQRNASGEYMSRGVEAKGFAGALVEFGGDGVELGLGEV
jgi:hypothetical protein